MTLNKRVAAALIVFSLGLLAMGAPVTSQAAEPKTPSYVKRLAVKYTIKVTKGKGSYVCRRSTTTARLNWILLVIDATGEDPGTCSNAIKTVSRLLTKAEKKAFIKKEKSVKFRIESMANMAIGTYPAGGSTVWSCDNGKWLFDYDA